MVEHGVDAIILIDIPNPSGRNTGVLSYDIHIHVLQESHFCVQSGLDNVVGFFPKTSVYGIGPNRNIIPIHSIDHEIFAIDYQLMSIATSDDGYPAGLGKYR